VAQVWVGLGIEALLVFGDPCLDLMALSGGGVLVAQGTTS